ncbi:MAG: CotH kinase family protein, partial [Akkermansia sp.]|nr:CotH kinase family protein [Akkermansia sp.]
MNSSIVSPFVIKKAKQGETLNIDYLAYDPATETAAVTLSVINPDGTVYSSKPVTVDRTPQKWTVSDYPMGTVTFRLAVSNEVIDKVIEVSASGYVIEPIADSLVLNFDAQGRSNQEENPGVWTDGTTVATFKDVSFAGSDGWLTDEQGSPMLRLLPGSEMTLPFKLFASDCRTNGATVEVEMATNNVRDYDSVVMSCLSGGRGFKIASQYAQLNSEQSEISMQFKEEQRVRVSFVIGPRNLKRMIYVFVDGVMCGAILYPDDDDFSQNPAAGITIGAESSGIDIYRIALYVKGLTRQETLSNYIADRPTLGARIEAHKRNDVLDVSDEVVITKLPMTLPYMIISGPELPQTKGNAKPCEIFYVDPAEPRRSFTATGASIDVQGTSSAGYRKKNFLISLLSGLTLTANGNHADGYTLRNNSIPVSVFCLKADVASSDNANNVELVRLYNDTCPYRHPAMQADPRIRYGIEGYPIVVFWQNTATGVTTFWGKYNFNNDKSTPEVFGWGNGYECWEIKNNGNDRVNFKKSDYTDSSWQDDFEAVYPKKTKDVTRLKRMTDWVVSTDRGAVSTDAEKAARLAKFKSEFENYFVKDAMLYYYIFTETFLMVDNRAKNFFPTYDPKIDRWYPFPYDMDTALGINNEGQLVFDYDLEDTDQVGGYDVYNAQGSVLWCNVRDAFPDELAEMYSNLRNATTATGETIFSYETVSKRFNEHQDAWPEAVWNEDAYEKYLRPLFDENDASYLTMLQGPKASQRDWWMFNGFRYRDSKYASGDASKNYITLRCYALGDITVTPYSHIWPRIKYASATVIERGKRNQPTTLINPNDKVTDAETYIYSADRLADIGDLSHLYVGYADFTAARKLQRLKLGDGADGYENTKLNELYVG